MCIHFITSTQSKRIMYYTTAMSERRIKRFVPLCVGQSDLSSNVRKSRRFPLTIITLNGTTIVLRRFLNLFPSVHLGVIPDRRVLLAALNLTRRTYNHNYPLGNVLRLSSGPFLFIPRIKHAIIVTCSRQRVYILSAILAYRSTNHNNYIHV